MTPTPWAFVGLGACLFGLSGCHAALGSLPGDNQEHPQSGEGKSPEPPQGGEYLQAGPVISKPSPPLDGRTLDTSPDGNFALSSDPLSGTITILRLDAELTAKELEVDPSAEPGPVALGNTRGFVLLRGQGELLAIDLQTAEAIHRAPVCASPEGLTVDGEVVHVTCRGGQLVSLDASNLKEVRSIWVAEDMRDVAPWRGGLVVSLFRTAELLFLDASGVVTRRLFPRAMDGLAPGVAWKMQVLDENTIVLGHQLNSMGAIGGNGTSAAYYSGPNLCGSIAAPTVSVIKPDYVPPATSDSLGEMSVPAPAPGQSQGDGFTVEQVSGVGSGGMFDFAVSSGELHFAFPGNALKFESPLSSPSHSLVATSLGTGEGHCFWMNDGTAWPEVPIAIASLRGGTWEGHFLVQTLAPRGFTVVQPFHTVGVSIAREEMVRASLFMNDDSEIDSGMRLFHMSVGPGLACVSCHPGGGTDAHVWNFTKTGPRRTQALAGGLGSTGALHWDAEFDSFDDFVDDVMSIRMGLGLLVPAEHKQALHSFINSLPAEPTEKKLDKEAVARGESLFFSEETECGACHGGPMYSDDKIYDVGTGGLFVTPSLLGVSERAPLLHDGCASGLLERFGLCGGGEEHGKTAQLSDAEINDLVEFMRSL